MADANEQMMKGDDSFTSKTPPSTAYVRWLLAQGDTTSPKSPLHYLGSDPENASPGNHKHDGRTSVHLYDPSSDVITGNLSTYDGQRSAMVKMLDLLSRVGATNATTGAIGGIPGSGPQGPTGPAGPPNVLNVGTVAATTGDPSVTITGTSPSQTVNFVLKTGPTGVGSDSASKLTDGFATLQISESGGRLYSERKLVYDRTYSNASPTNTRLMVMTNAGTLGTLDQPNINGYLPTFNVRDYGAKGDGVTDDRNAFQAALDAAYAAGGGTVIVPPSTAPYVHKSGIIIRRNTKLSAYGATMRRWTATFSWLRNFDRDTDSFPGYSGNCDIIVEGGTWDGGVTTSTVSSGNCFTFAHCERVTVRDVRFINACAAAHAIEFNGAQTCAVYNCSAEGMNTATTNSEAYQIDGAFVGVATCLPEDDTMCLDIVFDGCTTDKYGSLGYFGRMVGGHSGKAGKFHRYIRVVNCMSFGTIEHGIRTYQWLDSVIANNHVVNAGSIGIQVRPAAGADASTVQGVVVSGNTIRDAVNDGIQVTGESSAAIQRGTVVTGNFVYGSGGNGIQLGQYADYATVTGNMVYSAADTSIACYTNYGTVIEGNTILYGGSHGIGLDTSSTCIVNGNKVHSVAGYGIIISPNTNDCSITSNHVNNATSDAYRFSSGATNCLFTGNVARSSLVGLSITSTCTGIMYYGNDLKGSGGISDSGVGSISTAVNRV